MIESVNNDKIKKYAKLQIKKYREEMELFIVEGRHLVEEAKKQDLLVDAFSLDGSIGTQVSRSVMMKLSSLNTIPNVLGIVRKKETKDIYGNILILDDLQDPGNLGTIIRSAVAFGIDTIVASLNTVDVYGSKVIRASEGMIFNINYVIQDLSTLNLEDYDVFTTNVKEGEDIRNINIDKKYAIIVGNEGKGVSEEVASLAKRTLYIPMNKKCESLNVAIATSIILYEFQKK